MRAYYKYISTKEGNRIYELLEHLNNMDIDFCELHDITCSTGKDYKHSQSHVTIIVILLYLLLIKSVNLHAMI
jgi:hypothetical protein